MGRRWAAAVLMTLAWLVAAPSPAHGCSCEDLALADYADEIDRAFVGRLASRTEHSPTADHGVSLIFDVEHVYKGPVEPRAEVFTHPQESACGLDVSGRVGIVAGEWRGKMTTNSCSSPAPPAELASVFGEGVALPPAPSGTPWAVVAGAAAAGVLLVVVTVRRRMAR